MNYSSDLPVSVTFWQFLKLSAVWLLLALVASRLFLSLPFGFVVISVFIFAIPIALSGGYSSAVDQVHTLSYYKEGGWAHKVFSRRWLRTLLWVFWAFAATFFMLLQFATYSVIEWIALFITIPVYWICYSKIHGFLSSELKKRYVTTSIAIVWTRRLCPLLMLCIYGAIVWIFAGVQTYDSLTAALAAKRSGLPEQVGSHLIQVALQITTFADGFKSYAVGHFKHFENHLPMLLTTIGTYVVFLNACTTFSCFSIPKQELRRVFGPLSDDDVLPPISSKRTAVAAGVVTFVAFFLYVPLFAKSEAWVQGHPEILETIGALEKRVEKIDGYIYSPGTIQKIELAKTVALGKLNVSRATLEGQVDRAFDRMEQNVDSYLNWYYSLPAEYVRLAKLLTGNIEVYMEEMLSEHLQKGDANKLLSDGLTAAAATHKTVIDEYHQSVKAILAKNRLSDDINRSSVVKSMSLKDIYEVPVHVDVLALNARAAGAGVGVGVGIGASVTAKVVSKGIFKAAAKAVSKMVISKAAGAAGGAAIGGTIGSVFPVAGTIIGGVVGGMFGGVIVDAALLKLEESISRDDFKKEIVSATRDAKAEFKAKLFQGH